ncbi:MAG: sodium transporter, partial [Candidatus Latescibacteria bacterium]|nr:sodium transporter [Candidatus Latescibacterota bacterium]
MDNIQSLHMFDYIVIMAYFCIVIFIGVFFTRFIKQSKDFFAAGAAVPWWLAGISLWMASFSALTFVVYAELTYKYGFVAITLCWVVVPAMILAAVLFSSRWRRTRVMTPLGFMEQRYNKVVHQLFVWTGIPLRLIDNSIKIYSTAVFLAFAVGQTWFTIEVCIASVGIVMILYTLLGGQWAVLVTDFVQFIILCLAVLILFPLSLYAVGGFGGLVSKAPDGFFHLLSPPYGIFDWIMFCVLIALSYNATWGLVQKYNCVATETDARKVAILMGVLSAVGPVIFFIPVMAARILLPDLVDSKYAYVAISLKLLPTGVMGLMIAGMFSATMSSLGSEYNVLSGVLTKDFYGKIVRPDADESS